MGRFGLVFFIAYWASYLMLWGRVSRLRDTCRDTAALPSGGSLFLGTAALWYLWSDQHRAAKDPQLTRLVISTRITQLLLPVGVFVLNG
mgnify:CR=1 FL=1